MATLSPAELTQFSAIIDGILASADLQTISAKRIRKGLEAQLGVDLSERKKAVQDLIMERFDHANKAADEAIPTTEALPNTTNGYHSPAPSASSKPKTETGTETSVKTETPTASSRCISTPPKTDSASASDSDVFVRDEPAKKKRKSEASVKKEKEVDDATLAAQLQAQENRRTTRGGATPKRKRTVKQKRKSRVKAEDSGEEVVGSDGEVVVKEKVRKGGFHKLYHLSVPLADLVGEVTLSRPQVVKKIWEYIKANDLQDPKDKRQIRCDDKLQLVFKQDKVHMFTMNKILGKQLYDVEEE